MGEIKIGRMTIGIYATNSYFLYREGSPDCIVIDAPDEGRETVLRLEAKGFHVRGLLLTHGHFDHIWGAAQLRAAANELAQSRGESLIRVYALDAEEELLSDSHKNVSEQMGRPVTFRPNEYLKDGQELSLAGINFRVIATPGHTIGSACFYVEEAGFLLSGDTLFEESVGRTDFPTGSMGSQVRSIREKLFALPDETKVFPGHGGVTSIGHEKKYNPFAADSEV